MLLAVPTAFPASAPLGCVFLVPLWLACAGSHPMAAAGLGALTGTVYGMLISSWIPEVLRGYAASPAQAGAGLVAVSLWVGAPSFALLGLSIRCLARRTLRVRVAGFAAWLFALEECLSRAWWGVPWGLLGHSQLEVAGVTQLAMLGGVPLISSLLAATNAAAASAVHGLPQAARLLASLLTAWLALALLGLPLLEALRRESGAAPGVDLLVVQPNLPRAERWVPEFQELNLYRVQRFVERTLREDARPLSAILLPENLLTTPLGTVNTLEGALRAWVDGLGVPVITGLVRPAKGKHGAHLYRSSVAWIEPQRGVTHALDKQRAVPLLESSRRFPADRLLARLFGQAARGPRVQEADESGPLPGPVPVGVALCYEVLFPDLVKRRRSGDSVAILNLADDSWTSGESATRHLTAIARFRAVEQRLPLIRVAHGGLTAVIDPFGRLLETLPLDVYAATRIKLPEAVPPTRLERFALAGLPLLAGLCVWRRWGRDQSRSTRAFTLECNC